MLDDQDGKCALCGTTEIKGNSKYFSVDHDHKTGRVRGLLCTVCNTDLGVYEKWKDKLAILEGYLSS